MTHYVYDQGLAPHSNCFQAVPVKRNGEIFESISPGEQATDVMPRGGRACPPAGTPPQKFRRVLATAQQLGFRDEQAAPTLIDEPIAPPVPTPTVLDGLTINGSTSPPTFHTGDMVTFAGTLAFNVGPGSGDEVAHLYAAPTGGGATLDLGTAPLMATADPTVFSFATEMTVGLSPLTESGSYNFFATYAGDALNSPSQSGNLPFSLLIS